MPPLSIADLTQRRHARPNTIVYQVIKMLFNYPGKTMPEALFLKNLTTLNPAPTRPRNTLYSMTHATPHQYRNVLVNRNGMISFNPAWLVEIQKYSWY